MRDITLMPNDYIVTHIKTDTICELFSNDDVVYAVDERIVPLVRCKECKHWNNETDMTYCDRTVWFGTDADDYCSFGEVERSE